MRIKRFRAKDMKTVLQMVKEQIGPEAVILATREIKDPLDATLSVEVTAGIGYHPALKESRTQAGPRVEDQSREIPVNPNIGPLFQGLENNLGEIKELLLDLVHRSSLSEKFRDRKKLFRLYQELLEAELDPAIARSLVERVAREEKSDGNNLKKVLTRKLAGMIKTSSPLGQDVANRPRRLALIGPSGVGKTTTLAKLAALTRVRQQKKVALISLDAYRLGAAEQLKTYARIMSLPLRIAQDKEEFRQAVELFDNMELVFIDTSGRSLADPETLAELTGEFNQVENLSVLLVLSASTKDRDMAAIIRRVQGLPVEALIISKVDETERYGNVINNLIKFKKPVSFLTNGQKVPEDLVQATPERLAELFTAGGNGLRNLNRGSGYES